MKLGVSPITNTIFVGNTKVNKKGLEEWVKKEDVTDYAIKAVFEWFMNNSKDANNSVYQIEIKGYGTLTYDPKGVIEEKQEE